MRSVIAVALLFAFVPSPLTAQEKKTPPRDLDKRAFDVLKEVHNRGADGYNMGDHIGCYRLFEGSLLTVRAFLDHRPAEQKFIDESLAQAEREPMVSRRAFILHDSIEKLRGRLRETPEKLDAPRELKLEGPTKSKPAILDPLDKAPEIKEIRPTKAKSEPEPLDAPPREIKPTPKEPVKPPLPPKEGVMGRLFWKGQPLSGVQVKFVPRGKDPKSFAETRSDPEGRYLLEKVPAGQYSVLLTTPASGAAKLPDRYADVTTSPLIVDVKAGGDTLDFLLK